jgi:hypothetical protein
MGREFESPRAYQNPNLDGEIVLDPFLGSGSTLIASADRCLNPDPAANRASPANGARLGSGA